MKWAGFCARGLTLGLILTLTACGGESSSSSSGQTSYKEQKTMVIDILKSDDGKKALQEALSSPAAQSTGGSGGINVLSTKMLPLQTSEDIRVAVKDTITAPEYKKEID